MGICTTHEYILMRNCTLKEIYLRVEWRGLSISKAVNKMLFYQMKLIESRYKDDNCINRMRESKLLNG